MNAEFEFKCDHCPRSFPTAQGRGGHQKAHRNQKADRHLQVKLRRQKQKPSASSGQFKCKICTVAYPTARALGGHLKAHNQARKNKIQQDEHHRLAPAGPQVRVSPSLSLVPGVGSAYFDFHAQLFNSYRTRMQNYPSSAGSGVVPLFAGTGTGGLAPAQPSSAATGGAGHVGSGSHVGIPRHVNQKEMAQAQYFAWLGTSSLPQPSFVAPATVAQADGGTGEGVNLGGQQEVHQEETADGIDLTLRL
jgi:hypothetical protein